MMTEQEISRDIPTSVQLPSSAASAVVPPSHMAPIPRSQSFPYPPDYHHKRPREGLFGYHQDLWYHQDLSRGLPNHQSPPVQQMNPQQHQQQQHFALQQIPAAQPPAQQQQQPTPTKKKRSNNYIAPKKIPTTFNSQVSSSSGGLRRQLSGSKIESFLTTGDESMDVEAEASRPRSMSL